MFNVEYANYLFSKLSNFYSDYVVDTGYLLTLFDAYGDVLNYINSYATSVAGNKIINTTELDMLICLGYIRTGLNSETTQGTAFNKNTVQTYLPKNVRDTVMQCDAILVGLDNQIHKIKNTKLPRSSGTLTNNYKYLADYYIQHVVDYNQFGTSTRDTITAFTEDMKSNTFESGNKKIFVRDAVAYSTVLEDKWGKFIPVVDSKAMDRTEYRDFLSNVVGFEPTVDKLRKVTSILSGPNTVSRFRDKYTIKNLSLSEFLLPYQYGDREFIYTAPAQLSGVLSFNYSDDNTEMLRLQNVFELFRVLSPTDTTYFISMALDTMDTQNVYETISVVTNAIENVSGNNIRDGHKRNRHCVH